MPNLAELARTPHWQKRVRFASVGGMPEATELALPFHCHAPGAMQPRPLSPPPERVLPLRAIRVLDLSMGLARPIVLRHFADVGADAPTVASCGYYDWWRGWGGKINANPRPYEPQQSVRMIERNKHAPTHDFTIEDGRPRVRRLAAQSDVLVDNRRLAGSTSLAWGPRYQIQGSSRCRWSRLARKGRGAGSAPIDRPSSNRPRYHPRTDR
jgi:CoA-transferase family III